MEEADFKTGDDYIDPTKYSNKFACSLPKTSNILIQKPIMAKKLRGRMYRPTDKFQFLDSYTGKRRSKIVFYKYDDEPYIGNDLFINWGVFPNENSDDISKVIGPTSSTFYDMKPFFNDFFDYGVIYGLYFLSLFFAAFWVAGWPFVLIIFSLEQAYMAWIMTGNTARLLDYDKNNNFSEENYNE